MICIWDLGELAFMWFISSEQGSNIAATRQYRCKKCNRYYILSEDYIDIPT